MTIYRPVILLGAGVRDNPELIEHLCSLNIPVLLTWMAVDLIHEEHPAYCGRPGRTGQRAANIIQQKATHLYCFGARLDGEQVAYAYDRFAPNAKKYIYDVDSAEFQKYPDGWYVTTKTSGLGVEPCDSDWLLWCKSLYNRFRYELDGENDSDEFVNPFYLMSLLHEYSNHDDVFAIGSSGDAPNVFYQSYKVKQGQRVSNICTLGAMGADIPMALGAAMATGKRVICVTGDGGFQMNAQELETIRRLQLPIIFFVFNNNGYNSIRAAQLKRFGRVTGATPETGLTLPYLEDIADAYRFLYMKINGSDLDSFERCFIATPMIVEVMVDPEWVQLPRIGDSVVDGQLRTDNMEDLTPRLPKGELERIMNE